MKQALFNLTPDELESFVLGLGQPRFRAKQIAEWLNRGAPDFSVMKNLPENLRRDLDATALTMPCTIVQQLESADGQTTKFLLELLDGEQIECVLMRTTYGNSVCVSSQAGCAMGCKFCASTLLGLKRNLTANEMLAQVLTAEWQLRFKAEGLSAQESHTSNLDSVSHIVVMGTGEPLQNTKALIEFCERANHDMNIGWRKITISTCGIVPGIQELMHWGRPVNLAISLHAPNDLLRSQIMPINNKYPIAEVLDVAFACAGQHNRQLMVEYIALGRSTRTATKDKLSSILQAGSPLAEGCPQGGVSSGILYNCTPQHAEELAQLLAGRNCMVNIIPWNTVDERDFIAPSGNAIHRFQDILIANGVHTRIRRERGTDIGSACGQLRLNNQNGPK